MQIKKLKLIKKNLRKPKPIIDINIPSCSSVYFIYNKDLELIYVGQTNELRRRLVNHISPNTALNTTWMKNVRIPYKEVKYYSYIEINDYMLREAIEKIMISQFRPKYN